MHNYTRHYYTRHHHTRHHHFIRPAKTVRPLSHNLAEMDALAKPPLVLPEADDVVNEVGQQGAFQSLRKRTKLDTVQKQEHPEELKNLTLTQPRL